MEPDQAEHVAQPAAENLYEDERLRSNLSDTEASIVLNWAVQWIQGRLKEIANDKTAAVVLQNETKRVRQAIASFNELAKKPGNIKLADAVNVLEPPLQAQSLDRDQVFRLLTEMTTITWKLRDEKAKAPPPPMGMERPNDSRPIME
jgi:hypothetical protein